MFMTVISYVFLGLVAGVLARFLVPGRDPMGLLGTVLLGIAGSFMGGLLYNMFVTGSEDPMHFEQMNFIGSVVGAVVLLLIMRLFGMAAN